MRADRRRQRGSATIWLLSLMTVVVLAGVTALMVAQAVTARHQAGAAADLAALAAAARTFDGAPLACARAAEVAQAARARVVSCVLAGQVAEVTVEIRPRSGLAHLPPVRARARAGPPPVSPSGLLPALP